MRLSMSPSGSLIVITALLLPARLDQTRNQPRPTEVAQSDPRHLQLAVVAPRPSAHLTAVADAHGGRVARQLGELQARLEALLRRHVFVIGDEFERRPPLGETGYHLASAVVLLDRTLLCHASPTAGTENRTP